MLQTSKSTPVLHDNSYEGVQKELQVHGYNPGLIRKGENYTGLSIDCNSMVQYKHSEQLKSILGGRGFKVTCFPNSDLIEIR